MIVDEVQPYPFAVLMIMKLLIQPEDLIFYLVCFTEALKNKWNASFG